ncbi:MAG: chaperone modulator CbpM [Bacteroidota bacterium]|nr:chaperone modulator CbpM [Bacteroidota bacterium]
MQTEHLIALDEFCASNNIELSFINSLQQTGLIEITTIQDSWFIDEDQLLLLERFTRLYYELDINFEGIETITHLLQRVNALQDEITALRNRLSLYE